VTYGIEFQGCKLPPLYKCQQTKGMIACQLQSLLYVAAQDSFKTTCDILWTDGPYVNSPYPRIHDIRVVVVSRPNYLRTKDRHLEPRGLQCTRIPLATAHPGSALKIYYVFIY
jgi:hypothetical protein